MARGFVRVPCGGVSFFAAEFVFSLFTRAACEYLAIKRKHAIARPMSAVTSRPRSYKPPDYLGPAIFGERRPTNYACPTPSAQKRYFRNKIKPALCLWVTYGDW